MNPKMRQVAYEFCVKRDGKKCTVCKRHPVAKVTDPDREVKELVVDHLDNDNSNNQPNGSNWQLLCRRCNALKNPHGRRAKVKFNKHLRLKQSLVCGGSSEQQDEDRRARWRQSKELEKSDRAEPIVRLYVQQQLRAYESLPKSDLEDAAAEHCTLHGVQVSQTTVARYMRKFCNPLNGFAEVFVADDIAYVRKRKEINQ
jgi:hypothetical protein